MNGTRAETETLVKSILDGLNAVSVAEVVLCPPAIYVPLVADRLAQKKVRLGGQNLSQHKVGAYTGEISGPMLRDYHCTYVIVGHSERRALYGESDILVAEKFKAAQAAGLVPILCVGETLSERESNETQAVVARQLDAVLALVGIQAFKNAVIAYEPVWAIGTGRNASPEQAQEVHAFIRAKLAQKDQAISEALRLLYGGSVKANNAHDLFMQKDIDGGLIGGASLSADEFLKICQAAE